MLKRFILWDFARATWQYDVMVGVILAFIFLTPREWFRDQPRIPQASSISLLPSERGTKVFWVDPELLSGVSEKEQVPRLSKILRQRPGTGHVQILRVEPIHGSENEVKGYLAFAKP